MSTSDTPVVDESTQQNSLDNFLESEYQESVDDPHIPEDELTDESLDAGLSALDDEMDAPEVEMSNEINNVNESNTAQPDEPEIQAEYLDESPDMGMDDNQISLEEFNAANQPPNEISDYEQVVESQQPEEELGSVSSIDEFDSVAQEQETEEIAEAKVQSEPMEVTEAETANENPMDEFTSAVEQPEPELEPQSLNEALTEANETVEPASENAMDEFTTAVEQPEPELEPQPLNEALPEATETVEPASENAMDEFTSAVEQPEPELEPQPVNANAMDEFATAIQEQEPGIEPNPVGVNANGPLVDSDTIQFDASIPNSSETLTAAFDKMQKDLLESAKHMNPEEFSKFMEDYNRRMLEQLALMQQELQKDMSETQHEQLQQLMQLLQQMSGNQSQTKSKGMGLGPASKTNRHDVAIKALETQGKKLGFFDFLKAVSDSHHEVKIAQNNNKTTVKEAKIKAKSDLDLAKEERLTAEALKETERLKSVEVAGDIKSMVMDSIQDDIGKASDEAIENITNRSMDALEDTLEFAQEELSEQAQSAVDTVSEQTKEGLGAILAAKNEAVENIDEHSAHNRIEAGEELSAAIKKGVDAIGISEEHAIENIGDAMRENVQDGAKALSKVTKRKSEELNQAAKDAGQVAVERVLNSIEDVKNLSKAEVSLISRSQSVQSELDPNVQLDNSYTNTLTALDSHISQEQANEFMADQMSQRINKLEELQLATSALHEKIKEPIATMEGLSEKRASLKADIDTLQKKVQSGSPVFENEQGSLVLDDPGIALSMKKSELSNHEKKIDALLEENPNLASDINVLHEGNIQLLDATHEALAYADNNKVEFPDMEKASVLLNESAASLTQTDTATKALESLEREDLTEQMASTTSSEKSEDPIDKDKKTKMIQEMAEAIQKLIDKLLRRSKDSDMSPSHSR